MKNLDEMIRSEEFMLHQESKLGNDLFLTEPERADRRHKAAEFGGCGDLHCEVIEDWRDFLSFAAFAGLIDEPLEEKISKEIDEVEEWHEENGSLYDELG